MRTSPLFQPRNRRSRNIPATAVMLAALLLTAGCGGADSADAVPSSPADTGSPRPSGPVATTPVATVEATGPAPAATRAGGSTLADPAATAPACVRTAYSELTATERAGQLVMGGTSVTAPGDARTTVAKYHLGAVFLAGRTSHSPATVHKSIALLPAQETKHATVRLLVATDQEGGEVQTLRGGSWITVPAATVQAGWSAGTLKSRTASWVKQLHSAGITMDLAPVSDTVPAGTASKNPPIGYFDRQYGSNPATVAGKITTVTTSMKGAGVIPTVKHFPGLGRVRYNTDTSTKAVDVTTTVTDPYLEPFKAGISAGAGAVMVSSASYPKLDSSHLAVFSSKVITGLLRDRIGYSGVVMTDDVGEAVAVKSVPTGTRAIRFIAAGGDLVLDVVPSQSSTVVNAIAKEARGNSTFRSQVNASTLRVLELKYRNGLLSCS